MFIILPKEKQADFYYLQHAVIYIKKFLPFDRLDKYVQR
jgi:hypothetical protein